MNDGIGLLDAAVNDGGDVHAACLRAVGHFLTHEFQRYEIQQSFERRSTIMMTNDTVAAEKTDVRILEEADLDAVDGGYQQVWLGVLRAVLQFDRGTALRNQVCHPSLYE